MTTKLCKDCKHYRGTAIEESTRYSFHHCMRKLHEETDPVTGFVHRVGRLQAYEERAEPEPGEVVYLTKCGPEAKHWEPRTAEQLIDDKRRRDEKAEHEKIIDEAWKRSTKPSFWNFLGGR